MNAKHSKKDTISIYYVHEALHALHKRGIDQARILIRAGISPTLLDEPLARVSATQYGQLWHLIAQVLDDEFFGLDSHPMKMGSFTLLCHAIIQCKTLEQAMNRMLRFLRLIIDSLHGELLVEEPCARLIIRDIPLQDGLGEPLPKRAFAYGTFMIIVHGIACWLIGRRIPLLKASFRCGEPPEIQEWQAVFSHNLHFNEECSGFTFPAEYLHIRNIQNERTLKKFLRGAPANFLIKYKNRASVSARLRRYLQAMDPCEWPSFPVLAKNLNYSSATLRRKLDAEGTSFRTITDELRRAKAISLLTEGSGRCTVPDIASQLGFSEPSGFNRAFKKWTGATPSDYKRRFA